jgi:hypothetical protein
MRQAFAHEAVLVMEPDADVRAPGAADTEPEVRHLIGLALSGQVESPDGFTTPWRLRASRPSDVLAEETDRAEYLLRS